MSREGKIYITLLILIIAGIVYINLDNKEKINWFESYIKTHKIPYGTYVLHNELPFIFEDSKIQDINISPYEFLKNNTKKGLYLFIDKDVNFGKEEFEEIKSFVSEGSDIFISTHRISIDSLGFNTEIFIKDNIDDTPFFKLVNNSFDDNKYEFDRNFSHRVFSKIDTFNTTVLGMSGFLNKSDYIVESGANFVKYSYGNGNFYFHTLPEAFTNYFILKDSNENYTSGILSYLNKHKNVFWDSYYKTGRSKIESPLHYIFSNNSLKWAYYILLIGLLLFVYFEGKRKQKSIPVKLPLTNKSLAFTRTIANMYYEKSDHKKIAEYKINFLFEYIRLHFQIGTDTINNNMKNDLSAKSGISLDEIQKAFTLIEKIQNKRQITESELIQLEKIINQFRK